MELKNKTALITGSGAVGGIGGETARLFARRGASVIVTGRNTERGNAVVQQIAEAGGQARFVLADLSRFGDVKRLIKEAGDVDVLVNNHASFKSILLPTLEQQPDAVAETWDTNIQATYFLTAGLAPAMLRKEAGSIINISSIAGKIAMPNMSVYGAQKAALDSLTRSWASEFSDRNVRVNAVAPGTITSEAVSGIAGDAGMAVFASAVPMKRNASTSEIAEVIAFLASDRASFITGQTILADGGRSAI
ncbi:SDR family NAD(P)-dependent oxidoreductase [Streptomyces mirabilis]